MFACGPKEYHENLEYKKNDGDATVHESNITNPSLVAPGIFISHITVGIIANYNEKTSSYFGLCSGIRLNSTTILTAAHCISKMESMRVINGKSILAGIQNKEIYEIQNIMIHAFYDDPNYRSEKRFYDIAMIRLKNPLPYKDDVANVIDQFYTPTTAQFGSIKLSSDENLNVASLLSPIIAGFGFAFHKTSDLKQVNRTVGVLNESPVHLRIAEYNQRVINIHTTEISQACLGDSGGPLYIWRENKYYIQGLAVSVKDADRSDPFSSPICEIQSTYLNLDYFGSWIKEKIELL